MPAKSYLVDAPCWIDLTSSDSARVIPFYEKLFGWHADVSDEAEYGGYATFVKDGVAIAGVGGWMPGTTVSDVWNTYIASADADSTVSAVEATGGQVLFAPMAVGDQGKVSLVVDPGGAVTGIWEAGRHRGYGTWGEPGAPVWHEQFTRNFPAVLPFYESVFGGTFKTLADSEEFRYSQGLLDGDMIAGITDAARALPEGEPAHWRVYLGVEDTDAEVGTVIALGGTLVDAAEDSPFGRIAGVADPLGARFQIASVV